MQDLKFALRSLAKSPGFTAALFHDPEVRRASLAPAPSLSPPNGLVGNQVAQVPWHSASFGAMWRARRHYVRAASALGGLRGSW